MPSVTVATACTSKQIQKVLRKLVSTGRVIFKAMPHEDSPFEAKLAWSLTLNGHMGQIEKVLHALRDPAGLENDLGDIEAWKSKLASMNMENIQLSVVEEGGRDTLITETPPVHPPGITTHVAPDIPARRKPRSIDLRLKNRTWIGLGGYTMLSDGTEKNQNGTPMLKNYVQNNGQLCNHCRTMDVICLVHPSSARCWQCSFDGKDCTMNVMANG
ncbi:hypothetical protein BD410DRAFT_810434, partial [Rickenella mellea]